MKLASFSRLNISMWRIIALAATASASAAVLAGFAVGGSLGQVRPAILVVIGALVFYIVLSTPRRILDSQRVAEARESLLMSAEANACLAVTGSRPRTLIMLRSRNPAVRKTLSEAARMILLGARVEDTVETSTSNLASYSAAAALKGVAHLRTGGIDMGDEEVRGLASSSELTRETKLPMFMTVCFFTPIMLLLYAVFSHSYDPQSLAELAALEFIVTDLAFFLSSAERGPG